MEKGLKERLVGAAVLVILAVIFIPMLLGGYPESEQVISETNIPERPASKSGSRVVPLQLPVTDNAEITTEDLSEKNDVPDILQLGTPTLGTVQKIEDKSEIPESPTEKNQSKQVGLTAWVVQLGSFNTRENAELLNEKLRKSGYPAFVEPLKQDNGIIYRVRVGPELLRSDADALLARLKTSMKLDGIVLRYP